MKVLAFFLCDSASQGKNELWTITGAPLHHLIAKSFPAKFSLLVFVEVAEIEKSMTPELTLMLETPGQKARMLCREPLDVLGPLLSFSSPILTECVLAKPGVADLRLIFQGLPLAKYPLVVLKSS